ncbi:MAG: DUF1566 domain-containing protein [Leptospiraceae bacterium]|nr:DUF1566 domain-containing protein [Leptospiraceae bacterium]
MKQFYNVLFVFVLFSQIYCVEAPKNNICDSSTLGFQDTLILKFIISDYTPHCGFSLFGGRTVYFDPNPGYYSMPQEFFILSKIADTKVYYTIDESYPNPQSSIQAMSPLSIWSHAGLKIKALGFKSGQQNSVLLEGTYSYLSLQTGQIISYSANDDGATQLGIKFDSFLPTATASYPNDYLSKDKSTGLVWKSCSEGQSGASCAGAVSNLNFADATISCNALNNANSGEGYAGLKTWRLPTMRELHSINDASKASLTLNALAFPNTANFAYWSSTPFPTNNTFAWYVDFVNGNSYANTATSLYHARCVASKISQAANNFQDNRDGTVIDNSTRLFWERCTKGMTYNNGCSGSSLPDNWNIALNYCNNLTLAGKKWRLPNRTELFSLVDFSKSGSGATINDIFIPGTDPAFYWTSTSYVPNSPANNAWYMNFGTVSNSLYDFNSKSGSANRVRCVANE